MKVTIELKGKKYEVFGVESIEPMAARQGVFLYFIEKLDGYRWTQTVVNGKIVSCRLCELGQEYTTQETKKALGWI